MPGEDELIGWLTSHLASQDGSTLIGDDAAILPSSDTWAVTMDTQTADVHFFPDIPPQDLAQRLLAVNLSDLAATGATPAFAFLALTAPEDFDHRRFFRTLTADCAKHGMRLAGGDLSRAETCSAVLTLLGSKPAGGRWLKRDGARPGHVVWVGGTVGEAAAGLDLQQRGIRLVNGELQGTETAGLPVHLLDAARKAIGRHLRPTPQLELGNWLGRQDAGAAMDISDGLAKDLHRLCRASDVGAVLQTERLPIAESCRVLSQHFGVSPLDRGLAGGEDYVLLFTLPQEVEPPADFECHAVGTICEGSAIELQEGNQRRDLPSEGWDHLN